MTEHAFMELKHETDYNIGLSSYFGLSDLIEYLQNKDQDHVCSIGFHNPHSYRGYYEQLAFEPTRDTTIGEMLECAIFALDKVFEGYKGGDFTMDGSTDCWIAYIGSGGGEKIGRFLMDQITS